MSIVQAFPGNQSKLQWKNVRMKLDEPWPCLNRHNVGGRRFSESSQWNGTVYRRAFQGVDFPPDLKYGMKLGGMFVSL